MTDSEKLRLRAEWNRRVLHDPKSLNAGELRAMVSAFGRVLAEVCKEGK